MAKAPNKPATPAATAAVAVNMPKLPFSLQVGGAPPERTRSFGNGEPSPYVEFLKSMPAPMGDKFATFFAPAEVNPSITDADEKRKAAKEAARKFTNMIGSVIRRVRKSDAGFAFTTREVEENGVVGVRVWRVEPQTDAEANKDQTQAAAPPAPPLPGAK